LKIRKGVPNWRRLSVKKRGARRDVEQSLAAFDQNFEF
jgi:hypothetical protein